MSTLSVHVSNYNDAAHIGGALEAICTQSRQPDEVIVVDDGSTDNSIEVIEAYRLRFPVIRIERNETNCGVVFTINRGLHLAKGDFIYFASANDRILPGFFERSMKLLDQHPQAKLCFSSGRAFNTLTGAEFDDGRSKFSEQEGYLSGRQIAAKLHGISMNGVSYITNRQVMIEMGGYLPELKWHCDFFLHHMVAFRYGACYIPEKMVVWNFTPGSGYSSGLSDLSQQRQIFVEVQRLLYGDQFRDLIPLAVSGDFFRTFVPVLSLSSAIDGLRNARFFDSPAQITLLAFHLLVQAPLAVKRRQIAWALHETIGIVVNLWDQVFARSFHEYDRLRRLIRKILETP